MYGYKTENGITVINPEETAIIKMFLNYYISGLSIKKSKENSGIPLSEHALQHLLENDIYLGKNRYPPIIDKRTFSKISKIRKARTHGATRTTDPVVPAYSKFDFNTPPELPSDPVAAAKTLYDSLLPVQAENVA